jgi:hypothetical protein
MGAVAKILNVGRGEAILRSIVGVILIILAFLVSGLSRWVFGLIGVLFIITAIFGY